MLNINVLYLFNVILIAMNANDSKPKEVHNEQRINEGFSKENLPRDYDPSKSILKPEQEIDKKGNSKTVHRARNVVKPANIIANPQPNSSPNPQDNTNRGVTSEELLHKTVENNDHNSDITHDRYPDSHPDNYTNRGNIKLDG